MSETPKSTFSFQNSHFRFQFFFDQHLDFVLGTEHQQDAVSIEDDIDDVAVDDVAEDGSSSMLGVAAGARGGGGGITDIAEYPDRDSQSSAIYLQGRKRPKPQHSEYSYATHTKAVGTNYRGEPEERPYSASFTGPLAIKNVPVAQWQPAKTQDRTASIGQPESSRKIKKCLQNCNNIIKIQDFH